MAGKTVYKAPRYVKAANPDALIVAMVRNNFANGIEYHYFNIGKQDESWYAWFLADVGDLLTMRISDADG